jgi:hypothetical protein
MFHIIVFMAVKTEFMILWVSAPCSVVVVSIFNPADRSSMVVQNTGIQPPHYMAQQPRKPCI